MKKFLAIMICLKILILGFVACCGSSTAEAKVEEYNRLSVIKDVEIKTGTNRDRTYILVDDETGVCYLYVEGVECNAITVMVDADGKPLIWSGG